MKRPAPPTGIIVPHDYGQALEKAVTWLGDRYLLAEPAPRRRDEPAAWFNQSPRWHGATRPAVRARH